MIAKDMNDDDIQHYLNTLPFDEEFVMENGHRYQIRGRVEEVDRLPGGGRQFYYKVYIGGALFDKAYCVENLYTFRQGREELLERAKKYLVVLNDVNVKYSKINFQF